MAFLEGQKSNPVTQDTVLNILRDIDSQLNRLPKVLVHLTILGDRIEGSRPQEAGSPAVDHPPHCTIDDLRRKRETLSLLCSQIESATDRLDRAIGSEVTQSATRIA